jgi:hypothetical protein
MRYIQDNQQEEKRRGVFTFRDLKLRDYGQKIIEAGGWD